MDKFKQYLGTILCASAIAIPVVLTWVYAVGSGKDIIAWIGIICFMCYMIGITLSTFDMELEIRTLKMELESWKDGYNGIF